MSVLTAVAGALVIAAGSCLQGAVGFGSNLIAAPILVLLDPAFVPGPAVVASLFLNLLMTRREGGGAVHPRVWWAVGGQVPGAVIAGAALASLPERELSLLFGALVLVAVGISFLPGRAPEHPSPRIIAGGGLLSGFMGTVSGIGGPPIALVFQRSDARTLRGTLARYFLVGGMVSVATLVAVGRLGSDEVTRIAVLLPGVVVGFAASGPLARRLDRSAVRPVVLVLSTLSAVAVVLRELA